MDWTVPGHAWVSKARTLLAMGLRSGRAGLDRRSHVLISLGRSSSASHGSGQTSRDLRINLERRGMASTLGDKEALYAMPAATFDQLVGEERLLRAVAFRRSITPDALCNFPFGGVSFSVVDLRWEIPRSRDRAQKPTFFALTCSIRVILDIEVIVWHRGALGHSFPPTWRTNPLRCERDK